ncbi:MAG: cell division protein ZapB [Treponema sp.]|jgi:hypothetical protein|nr:cell division protein ZapB [Treponema sp.]
MVTLEQVRLLETKVVKAIDFVKQVTEENNALKGRIDSYQKRIDDLEGLILRFKEDQGRIEEGILSALNRLNQFEDAIEKSFFPAEHEAVQDEAPPVILDLQEAPPPEGPAPDERGGNSEILRQTTLPSGEDSRGKEEFLFNEDKEEDFSNTEEDIPQDEHQNNAELDIF